MSLAKAIATGDLTQLPSRRDEDWRWTDLRGLLRTLPPTPGPAEVTTEGPFAALGAEARDGFNLGINEGEAAGQTVFHLHFHVIPRHEGVPLKTHSGGMADVEVLKAQAEKIKAAL